MGGKTVEGRFNGSRQRVFRACQSAAAQLGYSVLHTDAGSGVITFNTGRSMKSWAGQDLSATVISEGSSCRVVVGGSLAKGGNPFGSGQVASWGEKSALSRKFLEMVDQTLPSIAEERAGVAAPPPTSVADELLKLKALLDAGVLTAAEMDDAKRKLLG